RARAHTHGRWEQRERESSAAADAVSASGGEAGAGSRELGSSSADSRSLPAHRNGENSWIQADTYVDRQSGTCRQSPHNPAREIYTDLLTAGH
ncbi:hypothetical protein AMELA_G00247580, partial [Ameiurus melas]